MPRNNVLNIWLTVVKKNCAVSSHTYKKNSAFLLWAFLHFYNQAYIINDFLFPKFLLFLKYQKQYKRNEKIMFL